MYVVVQTIRQDIVLCADSTDSLCSPMASVTKLAPQLQHWRRAFLQGTTVTTLTPFINHKTTIAALMSCVHPRHQNCNTDPYVHRRHNNYNADCLRSPMAPQLQHWLGVFNQNTWITALTLCAQPRRQNCDTDCLSSPDAPELQHQLPVFIQGTIITNLSSYFNPRHLYYNTNTLWLLQTSGQLHLNTVLTEYTKIAELLTQGIRSATLTHCIHPRHWIHKVTKLAQCVHRWHWIYNVDTLCSPRPQIHKADTLAHQGHRLDETDTQ